MDPAIVGESNRFGGLAIVCRHKHAALRKCASDHDMVEPVTGLAERFGIEQIIEPATLLLLAEPGAIAHLCAWTHPVSKAGPVPLDKRANLRDPSTNFGRLQPAPRFKTIFKAPCGRHLGLASAPRDNFPCDGQFAGRSDQGETLGHTPNLAVSSGRTVILHPVSDQRIGVVTSAVDVGHDLLKETMGGMPVVALAGANKMIGQIRCPVEPMQLVENAMTGTSIGFQIDDAHLLASGGAATAILGQLIGQADLAAAQEKQTPLGHRPALTGAIGARLALPVGEHVSGTPRCRWLDLGQLVQRQQRIAVALGDAFQRVVGGPPAADITGKAAAAPNATREMQ